MRSRIESPSTRVLVAKKRTILRSFLSFSLIAWKSSSFAVAGGDMARRSVLNESWIRDAQILVPRSRSSETTRKHSESGATTVGCKLGDNAYDSSFWCDWQHEYLTRRMYTQDLHFSSSVLGASVILEINACVETGKLPIEHNSRSHSL